MQNAFFNEHTKEGDKLIARLFKKSWGKLIILREIEIVPILIRRTWTSDRSVVKQLAKSNFKRSVF
jgi:hypothetical protein